METNDPAADERQPEARPGREPRSSALTYHCALVLREFLAQQPELFIDLAGRPLIVLPPSAEGQTGSPCLLESGRVEAWLADFAFEDLSLVLSEPEVKGVVRVLKGKAWKNIRDDVSLADAVDEDPLLDALMLYAWDHPSFEGSCTTLLKELAQVARAAGLDTKDKLWPLHAPSLSRRISTLSPHLRKANILATIGRRTSGQRYVRLVRHDASDDGAESPSAPPSKDKSQPDNHLKASADDDSELRAKRFAKIDSSNRGTYD